VTRRGHSLGVAKQQIREGVLVIGAWAEPGSDCPLRARVTCRPSTAEQDLHPYEASVEDILERVKVWLEVLTDDSATIRDIGK
jgi:hypothetical protein